MLLSLVSNGVLVTLFAQLSRIPYAGFQGQVQVKLKVEETKTIRKYIYFLMCVYSGVQKNQ